MSSNAFTCLLWAAHFYRLVISGVISPFDLILHYLRTGAVCHWPVSVSWHAEHSEHRRHSRLSCSRCRRRVWLAPPTHTVDVRLCSFHLWADRKTERLAGRAKHTWSQFCWHTHRPETCGLQGIVLQICSWTGLVLESHSWLCFFSGVRHRTSLICKPFPQDFEHWEQKRRQANSINIISTNLWFLKNFSSLSFHLSPRSTLWWTTVPDMLPSCTAGLMQACPA